MSGSPVGRRGTGPGLDAAGDGAPCPVLVADPAGELVDLNQAATRLFPLAEPGTDLADAVPRWLADAHAGLSARGDDTAAAAVPVHGQACGRSFAAHPSRRPDGTVVWWLIDETGRRLAEAELAKERERTALLAESSNALLSSLNIDRCTEATVRLAATHLADAVVLVAPAAANRLPVALAVRGGEVVRAVVDADPGAVPGLSEALQGFPPIPSRWIDPGALPAWAVPDGFTGPVGSVVVTPLPGHGVPAGALILLRHADRTVFSDGEEVFARLFAARAGVALSAARVYAEQSAISATLMRELLPPRLHHVDGVDYAGGYRASVRSELIGGDFYDVHPGPDGESLVVLGDVCGKGLEAAVITGKIRNTLQALLPMAGDHARMLSLLNGALISAHTPRFATLVLASAVRSGDRVRLRLTSAGHLPPLIIRADGGVEEAGTRGCLIGVLPEIEATTAHVDLAPGETCVLYTDGIVEAKGGPLGDTMFGEPRLADVLSECAGMPAEAVVERVQMLAAEWVGHRLHDDMAVVAIAAPPAGRPGIRPAPGHDGSRG